MSRLFTCGWETGAAVETSGSGYTVVSSPARSGGYAAQFSNASTLSNIVSAGTVLGRNYFTRAWIRFPAAPSASQPIIFSSNGTTAGVTVRANTDRTLSLLRGSTVVATSVALAVDTWHLVQLRLKHIVGVTDEGELVVNGTSVGTFMQSAAIDTAPAIQIGRFASGTYTIWFDDLAVNDDQGTVENSWPDDNGAVILLKPVADAQIVGAWSDAASATTGLWDGVDNIPPAGTNSPSAKSQIQENAADSGSYDARLESYASRLTGPVKLVQPMAFHGCAVSGGVTQAVSGVSNPASAAVNGATSASSVQAFPANWSLLRGTLAYGDIADRSTPPVVRIQKISVSSVLSYCCQMGLMVEYVPGTTYTDIRTGIFKLTGSVVESYQVVRTYGDAPIGVLVLDGWIYVEGGGRGVSTLVDDFSNDVINEERGSIDQAGHPLWQFDYSSDNPIANPLSLEDDHLALALPAPVGSEFDTGYALAHLSSTYLTELEVLSEAFFALDTGFSAQITGGSANTRWGLGMYSYQFPEVSFNRGGHGYREFDNNLYIHANDRTNYDASIPYDPDEHVWFRARLDGTTLRMETSPDGNVWTEQLAAPDWDDEGNFYVFEFDHETTTDAGASTLYVDNINVIPSVSYSDAPTGALKLSGSVVESYQGFPIKIYTDVPTGKMALSGSVVESYSVAHIFTDAPTGKITLSGTCVSAHTKDYSDNPTGKIALGGSAAITSQRSTSPVGSFKLSGFVGLAGKEYIDTCAGVLALVGVVSQALAYTDEQTGNLIVNGTAVSEHLIVATDDVVGTLRLAGSANEYIEVEGQIIHDDRVTAIMMISGRLITPGQRPDAGIGGLGSSSDTRLKGGRIVTSLTGRLRA